MTKLLTDGQTNKPVVKLVIITRINLRNLKKGLN